MQRINFKILVFEVHKHIVLYWIVLRRVLFFENGLKTIIPRIEPCLTSVHYFPDQQQVDVNIDFTFPICHLHE